MADLFEEAIEAVSPEPAVHDEVGDLGISPSNQSLRAAIKHGYDPVLWLGQGSTASVWRCVDRSFGREVAVKQMRSDLSIAADERETLLQREAEILGKLNHPGIVHAVRRIGSGSDACLVMEFVDGDDLFLHCRAAELSFNKRIRLFARVVDAVSYLHDKGLVHGDLKPEHILVREDNYPVLIDFGLSSRHMQQGRIADSFPRIGGSGTYRAPEIVDRSTYAPDPRQDVYALGQILRGLLDGVDTGDGAKHFATFIDKSTADSPPKRWADAREMKRALSEVLSSQSQTGPEPTGWNAMQWVVISAAILLAISGGAAWMTAGREATPNDLIPTEEHRDPVELTARASILERIASSVHQGKQAQAQEQIQGLLAKNPVDESAWEVRHLQALVAGKGKSSPFGDVPYGADISATVAYEPGSKTIAYVRRQENVNVVWIRVEGEPPRRLGQTREFIKSIAIRPDAGQVAALVKTGEVLIWTDHRAIGVAPTVHRLPRPANAKALWYSKSGKSLYLFSPTSRKVERWRADDASAGAPELALDGCDQARPLPSGEGLFFVCTAGTKRPSGRTLLRVLDDDGTLVRELELEDSQLPASADSLPGQNRAICLGMPNGYVRIHDASRGGWLPKCDLGRNASIPSIAYSTSEQRVFASLGRVHVIDMNGQLLLRLGNRDANEDYTHQLSFDESSATLTTLSNHQVAQWNVLAKESE